ncbi:helix-turn-helix domain-containing protein [Streptomyces sp. NPDC026659]|uniref:NACHT domain-containing protein n=1 Tax=Streptomyces sp. NPDC026659 TaxID=3155123 RepID=UPI0033C08108
MGETSGAVADFCGLLRRLVRGCGVPQSDLARALHRSEPTVSALLNARRATPPSWDDVLGVVEYCRTRGGPRPPAGLTFDRGWWRLRLEEVEANVAAVPVPRAGRQRPANHPSAAPPPPVEVAPDFAGAVEILVGGRPAFHGLAEEILEPLRLTGGTAADLRPVLEGFAERVRSSHGTARTALLCAADLAVLVTAFCQAVAQYGIVYEPELDATRDGAPTADIVTELEHVTLGSVRVGTPDERRHEIETTYSYAADLVHGTGARDIDPGDLARTAWRRYETLLDHVLWDCPELRLTSRTEDPPEAVEQPTSADRKLPTALTALADLLEQFADGGKAPDHHRHLLRAPLAAGEAVGPRIPTLGAGYVDPAFRVASYTGSHGLSRDDWWLRMPLRDDLAEFLAAYLLTDDATHGPLVVLGHPGSGKSLLTKLIAAHLPASEFFCLRVELRHLSADLDVRDQIEEALWRSTGRRTSWAEVTGPDSGVVRVVLLDGFDELLQAAADQADRQRHHDYLLGVERFQRDETDHGRPTAVVVTSRTVVADQARTPSSGAVIRLEPFDDARVAHWLRTWNATNRRYFLDTGLRPLAPETLRPHRELAAQPLLLMMLALYDASDNVLSRQEGAGIDRLGLYERLLAEFVRRQVGKHQGARPTWTEAAVERELQRLSVIAIGMFNRRKQSITAHEAEDDLAVLLGGEVPESSSLLFGRFFFIHESQAVVTHTELRSYEFLHATFGEYLLTRLITDELHCLLIGGDDTDDGRLHALLSHVPLSDRAEALADVGELLAPLPSQHRSELVELLGLLFRRTVEDDSRRTHVLYHPAPPHRTRQDAVYTANLLLLAARAANPLPLSRIVGGDATMDRWQRQTHLWRSQFGEASWTAFITSLRVQPADRDARDLAVLPGTEPAALDPAWGLDLIHLEKPTGTARIVEQQPLPTRLHALAAFTWDTDLQCLLQAVAPLLDRVPDAFTTYRFDGDNSISAAHDLIALLCRPDPRTPYGLHPDILDGLRELPGDNRALAVDLVARHLRDAARDLPPETAVALLDALTSPQHTGSGEVAARTWLVLADCLARLAARRDVSHAELRRITSRFRREAPALDNDGTAELRLESLLEEASTTHLWRGAHRADTETTLAAALTLHDHIPEDRRPPTLVIGLLRLARDLGADDWLAVHAERLLLTLDQDGLWQLRPTDVDWMRPVVRDRGLRAELDRVVAAWR